MFNRWWLSKGFRWRLRHVRVVSNDSLLSILKLKEFLLGTMENSAGFPPKHLIVFHQCHLKLPTDSCHLRIHHSHQGKAVLLSKLVWPSLKLTANAPENRPSGDMLVSDQIRSLELLVNPCSAQIAMVFLNEYLSNGAWSGICETGLETMPLENEAWLKDWYSIQWKLLCQYRTSIPYVSVHLVYTQKGIRCLVDFPRGCSFHEDAWDESVSLWWQHQSSHESHSILRFVCRHFIQHPWICFLHPKFHVFCKQRAADFVTSPPVKGLRDLRLVTAYHFTWVFQSERKLICIIGILTLIQQDYLYSTQSVKRQGWNVKFLSKAFEVP